MASRANLAWLVLLCAAPAFATVADTFSIKEVNGTTTTNYPVQMGRPIADNEILHYPQVGICTDSTCASVSSWLTTQADVKQRWTSGYVKHAILSFYIPTLTASSTVYLKIQDQSICNCGTGETKANMLANYNFDATETYSNGVTATVSAKTILTAWDGTTQGVTGPVYYFVKGSIATTLIIADHRNLSTCNGHACSSNDFGSDANKSLRPEFHVTFWPAISKVKVRFVGEIVNTESMQNQSYDINLSVGSSSPTTVYTQTGISHGAAERWTVDTNDQSGQTWAVSTAGGTATFRKEIWIGGVPPPIAINHNLAYLVGTYFVPNYDLTVAPTESAIESFWSAWSNPTGSYLFTNGGYWNGNMGTTGASTWIGPLPDWTTAWLYSGDIRLQELSMEVSALEGNYDEHIIEGAAGKNMNRADSTGAGTGVGRVISTASRLTFDSSQDIWNNSGAIPTPTDRIVPVGTVSSNSWDADAAHQPDYGSAQYAVTGDYYFLQEQLFSAAWMAAQGLGADTSFWYGRGPTGAEGAEGTDSMRALAWTIRAYQVASMIAPDSDFSAEASHFKQMMTDFIAVEEGAHCGASDVLSWCSSSANHGNTLWQWGYTYRAQINALGQQGTTPPTAIPFWWSGESNSTTNFVQQDYGIGSITGTGTVSNSAGSSTITFSSSTQCSALVPNETIDLTFDGGGEAKPKIVSLSCPNAVIDQTGLSFTQGATNTVLRYYPVTEYASSLFELDYLMYSLGRAKELGFATDNLISYMGPFFIGLVNDSGSNPRLLFNGRVPTVDLATGHYFTTYSRLKQGYDSTFQNASSGFLGAGPPVGYAGTSRAAVSMLSGLAGGATAWTWYQSNVTNDTTDFATDPQWALNPRSLTCTINTTSLPSVNTGSAYSQTLSQSNCNASSWTITSGSLTGSGLSLSSGTISGTAATAGTYSFTVSYDTASQPLSITVTTPGTITPVMIDGALTLGGSAIFRF